MLIRRIHILLDGREVFAGTLHKGTKAPLWGNPDHCKTVAHCQVTQRIESFWTEKAAEFWLVTHATNNAQAFRSEFA